MPRRAEGEGTRAGGRRARKALAQFNPGHGALLTNARDQFLDLREDVAHHNGDALRRRVQPVSR